MTNTDNFQRIDGEDSVGSKKLRGGNFSGIFLVVAVILMTLPFINTFNEFLTNELLKWHAYRVLQEIVVPYEAKVVAGMMNLFGLPAEGVAKGVWVTGLFLEIQWNCLGWQSMVLLLASFISGFQKKNSWTSRFEVIIIGFLGTYIISILRLLIVGLLAVKVNGWVAIFFHDYLALIFVILWFFVFWWFSYTYVLEERVDEG